MVDDERQVLRLIHPHPAVRLRHRSDRRAAIFVEHLDSGVAGGGIFERQELPLDGCRIGWVTDRFAVEDGLRQVLTRDHLLAGVYRQHVRHPLVGVRGRACIRQVTGDPAVGITGEPKIEIDRGADLHIAEIHPRTADALHRHQDHHHSRPLGTSGRAARPADAVSGSAGTEISLAPPPFASQRADVPGRHAGLLLGPFRSLGDTVLAAHDVVGPLVKAGGAILYEVLVVKALVDPDVADRLGQCGIGVGPWRDPLTAEQRGGVVPVRIDVDELDAEFLRP